MKKSNDEIINMLKKEDYNNGFIKFLQNALKAVDDALFYIIEAIIYIGEIVYEKKHLNPPDKMEDIPEKAREFLRRHGLEDFGPLVLEDLEKRGKYYSVWDMRMHMGNPWAIMNDVWCDGADEVLDPEGEYFRVHLPSGVIREAGDLLNGKILKEKIDEMGADYCKALLVSYVKYYELTNEVGNYIMQATRFEELHHDLRCFLDGLERSKNNLNKLKKDVVNGLELKPWTGLYGKDLSGIVFYNFYSLGDYIVYIPGDVNELPLLEDNTDFLLVDSLNDDICEDEEPLDLDDAITYLKMI